MKKFLLRAGMSPLISYRPEEVFCGNLISNNLGNILYQSSVARTLLLEDMQMDTIHTKREHTSRDIRLINETYSHLVLPFANAFRKPFIEELNNVTDLVSRLKIPCTVVGVGAQALLDQKVDCPELDEAVKKFMKAVLNRSAIVGVRGEFTADYLKSLGFQAERDYTVIGCPSMYLYGGRLPEPEVKELTPDSRVSMNSKIGLSRRFHDFMWKSSQALPDHVYIPQVIEEIRLMYAGAALPETFWNQKIPEHFPGKFDAPVYTSGRGLAFANAVSWIRFLRERDFSFGSRIHGNIAAILAGTPCFVIVSNQRIAELVSYHHIPHLSIKELNDQSSIFALHEKADFSALNKGHRERFERYVKFLHANGLATIYDSENSGKEVPFDLCIKKQSFAPPIRPFLSLTPEEQFQRLNAVYREENRTTDFYKEFYFQNTSRKKRILGAITREEPEGNVYPLIRRYDAELRRYDAMMQSCKDPAL